MTHSGNSPLRLVQAKNVVIPPGGSYTLPITGYYPKGGEADPGDYLPFIELFVYPDMFQTQPLSWTVNAGLTEDPMTADELVKALLEPNVLALIGIAGVGALDLPGDFRTS